MSRRNELETHRKKLSEIRSIMHSMKILSVMETHKLENFITAQNSIADTITTIARDFLHFYPQVSPELKTQLNIVILIGSERGFCGDFNDQLVQQLDNIFEGTINEESIIIAVGSKLHALLDEHGGNILYLKGADISEEVSSVVTALADTLAQHTEATTIYSLHHDNLNTLVKNTLLPPFNDLDYQHSELTFPPLLNIDHDDYFIELTDHYLFSALHKSLYTSLLLENQQRIQHLENASRHLDDKTDELKGKINVLRQEEIIEEIEVILLNASTE